MPKEIIDDFIAGEFSVNVGWERDGYVQVGTTSRRGEYSMMYVGEDNTPIGEAFTASGLWSTLDRQGCNRLIHALRRARDQAYGADA